MIVSLPLRSKRLETLAKLCRNKIMRCPAGYAFKCPFGFDKDRKSENCCHNVTAEMWARHAKEDADERD